jgi:pimeloyl-ACP methyl ester carboxylesterase
MLSNLGTFEPSTSEAEFEGYLQQLGADPGALIRVLDTFVDTPREALARVAVPTLVIAGDQDNDRGSVEDLAATLSRSRLQKVPGNHVTALFTTELKDHLARFLGDHAQS